MGDTLSILLLILIAIFGAVDFACLIEHLQSGGARWGWTVVRYTRREKPFYYWLIVLARLSCLIVAFLLFRLVVGMRS